MAAMYNNSNATASEAITSERDVTVRHSDQRMAGPFHMGKLKATGIRRLTDSEQPHVIVPIGNIGARPGVSLRKSNTSAQKTKTTKRRVRREYLVIRIYHFTVPSMQKSISILAFVVIVL